MRKLVGPLYKKYAITPRRPDEGGRDPHAGLARALTVIRLLGFYGRGARGMVSPEAPVALDSVVPSPYSSLSVTEGL